MIRRTIVLLSLLLLTPAVCLADLCAKCRGKMFITSIGKCGQCGGMTTSRAFRLCDACSKNQGICQACGAHLVGGEKPPVVATQPDPKIVITPAGPVDRTNGGTYKSGPWTYTLTITNKGANRQGELGSLLYNGKAVPDGKNINDHYKTPWGALYWTGRPAAPWEPHEWSLARLPDQPDGAEMKSPPIATSQPTSQPDAKAKMTHEQAIRIVRDFLIGPTKDSPNPLTDERIRILGVNESGNLLIVRFKIAPANIPSFRRVDRTTGQVLPEAPRL